MRSFMASGGGSSSSLRTLGCASSSLAGASSGSSMSDSAPTVLSRFSAPNVVIISAAASSGVSGSLPISDAILARVSFSTIQRSTSSPKSSSSGAVSRACCPMERRYSRTVSVGSSRISRS